MNTIGNDQPEWEKLGAINPADLKSTLGQLHQAISFVQAVGTSYIPKKADDSHSNTGWSEKNKALIGNEIEAKAKFQVGLKLSEFELVITDEKAVVEKGLPLDGNSRLKVLSWLKEAVKAKGCDPDLLNIDLRHQMSEYSPHPEASFNKENPDSFAELAAYFSNAHFAIETATADLPNASDVRCWPHHFDIASLITVQENPDPEKMKSIGVGLSPGDGSYSEPYFYVTPWPYPKLDTSELPAIEGGGFWHTQNWTGAILPASEFSKKIAVTDQQNIVRQFLKSAIQSCFVFFSLDL